MANGYLGYMADALFEVNGGWGFASPFGPTPVILTLRADLYGVCIFNVITRPLSNLTFQYKSFFNLWICFLIFEIKVDSM